MNESEKKLWTDALRSGDYEQENGMLKNAHAGIVRHCCLGVAVEVLGTPLEKENNLAMSAYGESARCVPDAGFQRRMGMDADQYDMDGVFAPSSDGIQSASSICMDMNDDKGKTFAEIADWIDKNL